MIKNIQYIFWVLLNFLSIFYSLNSYSLNHRKLPVSIYDIGNEQLSSWNKSINSHDMEAISSFYAEKFDMNGAVVLKKQMQKLKSDYFKLYPKYSQEVICEKVIFMPDTSKAFADVMYVIYSKKWTNGKIQKTDPSILKFVKLNGKFLITIETNHDVYTKSVLPKTYEKLPDGTHHFYQKYFYEDAKRVNTFLQMDYTIECNGDKINLSGTYNENFQKIDSILGKGYKLSTIIYHFNETITSSENVKAETKEQFVFGNNKLYSLTKINNGEFYIPLIKKKE